MELVSVPIAHVKAIRLQCFSCQGIIEIPPTAEALQRVYDPAHIQNSSSCKLCGQPLVKVPGGGTNPLHHLAEFLKAQSQAGDDRAHIGLVLPVERHL